MALFILIAAAIGVLLYLFAGNPQPQNNRRTPPDEEPFDETDPLFYQQLEDIDDLF